VLGNWIARRMFFVKAILLVAGACLAGSAAVAGQSVATASPGKGAELRVANAPIPIRVLVQSPAETETELQVICLFRSDPSNSLHGSLVETNAKLKGLLERIRKPNLFRGDLGETMLLRPPAGSLAAKRLLIIGLGDSEGFSPERMELVGAIAYREANRLEVSHPFFAPTVIDGGVTKFTTGEVAEQVIRGFLRAARTHKVEMEAGAAGEAMIQDLTYLAGAAHAEDTKRGIEKAIAGNEASEF
jgi:hypothetical protein